MSGIEGWLNDGLFAPTLILMIAAIAALRPAVRRRAVVLLLPAFVTTALAGLWLYERLLRRREPEKAG